MTTTTAPRAPAIGRPALGARVRETIGDVVAVTRRDLIRTARMPEMLTFAVIMGVFFLLIFNYARYMNSLDRKFGVDEQ